MTVCYVSSIVLVLLGALIGGIVALLLKWACLGVVLGALVSLCFLIADKGTIISSTTLVGVVFGIGISCGLILSFIREKQSNIAGFTVLGGLMFASGIDLIIHGGLVYNIGVILQKRWPEGIGCHPGKCHLYWLLAIWCIFSVVACAIQILLLLNPSPFQLLKRNFAQLKGGGYEPIPDARKERLDTATHEDGSKQRTLYYPDNQGFNYFNPDHLPQRLQEDVQNIYHAATLLANFFGFQDDNVRNQTEHCMLLVLNYRRYSEAPPLSKQSPVHLSSTLPAGLLHKKVFENYQEWCNSLQVRPLRDIQEQ